MNERNHHLHSPILSGSSRQYKALCTELAHASSLDEFSQKIDEIIQELGFTDFLFLRLERVWQSGSSHGLLYSLPEELMRAYLEEGLYKNDLLIPYSKTNTQPIFSSQVYGYINQAPFDIGLTQKNRELYQLHQRFNYFDHYVIPMPACNGNGNVQLLLTASGLRPDEFRTMATPVMSISRVLCQAIDSVSTKKFRPAFIEHKDNPIKITPKQREMLHELANRDTSITDLAKAMSVSSVTAHQHISAAREALGVNTNIAAVVKALHLGLITIE